MTPEWITLTEACALLDCARETLHNRARGGQVTLYQRTDVPREEWQPNHRFYFRRADIHLLAVQQPIERIRSTRRHEASDVLDGRSPDEFEWITVAEAAALIGISVQTFYRMLMADEFRGVSYRLVPSEQRVRGAKVYLRRDQIEAALQGTFNQRIYRTDDKTPAAEDCIYLAGLFDGEGCITIQGTKGIVRYFTLVITIANNHAPVLHWVKDTFGGRVTSREKDNPRWCTGHVWSASTVDAYRTLQRIGPFLRIKHRQAELAIEFYERTVRYSANRHRRLTDEERRWRQEQCDQIRSLNGRRAVHDPNWARR